MTQSAKLTQLEEAICLQLTRGNDDGLPLEEKETPGMGRGVYATSDIGKGNFVVEYAGDLVTLEEAKRREQKYGMDPKAGSYMYYFRTDKKSYCLDATAETGRLGRLVNHSKKNANLKPKVHMLANKPHIIMLASRDIKAGEELLFDYGDTSKASLVQNPWLKD